MREFLAGKWVRSDVFERVTRKLDKRILELERKVNVQRAMLSALSKRGTEAGEDEDVDADEDEDNLGDRRSKRVRKTSKITPGSSALRYLRRRAKPAWEYLYSLCGGSEETFTGYIAEEIRRKVRPRPREVIADRVPLVDKPYDVLCSDPEQRKEIYKSLAKVDKIPTDLSRRVRIEGGLTSRAFNAIRKLLKGRLQGSDAHAAALKDELIEAETAVPTGAKIGAPSSGAAGTQRHQRVDDELQDEEEANDEELNRAAARAATARVDGADDADGGGDSESGGSGAAGSSGSGDRSNVQLPHKPLNKLSFAELEHELRQRGVDDTGTKQQKLIRLSQFIFRQTHAEEIAAEERRQAAVQKELEEWEAAEESRRAAGAPAINNDSDLSDADTELGDDALPAAVLDAWGVQELCDAVRIQVVDALVADLVLPGSASSKLGMKVPPPRAFPFTLRSTPHPHPRAAGLLSGATSGATACPLPSLTLPPPTPLPPHPLSRSHATPPSCAARRSRITAI